METTQLNSKLQKEKILVQQLWKSLGGAWLLLQTWRKTMNKNIKTIIETILSKLFPVESFGRCSVFVQQSWIERHMQEPYLKDILWSKR
jgi:hypothetical protein